MLIKCQKCGHENQLGAIFCRNCGEKLDIEQLRPDVAEPGRRGCFGKTVRFFGTIMMLLLFAFFILIAIPSFDYSDYCPPIDDAGKNAAKDKFEKFNSFAESGKPAPKDLKSFVFTPAEITYLFNEKILAPHQDKRSDFGISTDKNGRIKIVTFVKLYDKAPVKLEIVGRLIPQDDSDDNAKLPVFKPISVKLGYLPLIGDDLNKIVIDKFSVIPKADSVAKLLKSVENIEIDDDGNFVFTPIKAVPVKPAAK